MERSGQMRPDDRRGSKAYSYAPSKGFDDDYYGRDEGSVPRLFLNQSKNEKSQRESISCVSHREGVFTSKLPVTCHYANGKWRMPD